MDTQPQFTPEQKAKVKKAKLILWISIAAIIIIGVLIAVYFVFLKSSPDKVVKTTPIDLDTSHWQSYANEQYGFSLKFPMEWTLEQVNGSCTYEQSLKEKCSNDIVKLDFLSDYHIYISHQGKNSENLKLGEWLKQKKNKPEEAGYPLKYDSQTGISIEGLAPGVYQGAVTVYFAKGDNVFGLEWFDNNKQNEQVWQVFNKILLSITFTEPTT